MSRVLFGLFVYPLSSALNCILVQFTVWEGWVDFDIVIEIKVCDFAGSSKLLELTPS